MPLSVIKFSSEDCGICHKMAFYDQKVAAELGLEFVDVKMQDTATYRKYRQILLAQYPDKSQMGWPTYIICESPEGEFKIVGEVKGGHPKGEFRNRLQAVLDSANVGSEVD
ncbi:thioredoxin family protein [Calothrix sp. UHCC 0171]|uniref:thioredoxin family protein n=1 Tax=Calothrix sp. UHCC 0171 TaxID=3110245 RepID=UPI002B1F2459|nr:thioredoxin family protein [Calothrix sp. UHCC 0171]MEA5572333.1 thioredoxin family protein [Calothrix sp. UHCC 0171]